jgi:hypothetical protein
MQAAIAGLWRAASPQGYRPLARTKEAQHLMLCFSFYLYEDGLHSERHGSGCRACRKPIGWRSTENRAMLICNESSCQAHVSAAVDLFRSRAAIEAEILTLRQQIIVLRQPPPRIKPSVPSTDWCSLVSITLPSRS